MFSKTCVYAIRAVLYLAIHSDDKTKLGVTDLSEKLVIPKHFLAKVLQQLARHKLINSTKGPSGGFYMSSSQKESRLSAVINCFDGPDRFDRCVLGLKSCNDKNPCSFHHHVKESKRNLDDLFRSQSILNIANDIKTNNYKI